MLAVQSLSLVAVIAVSTVLFVSIFVLILAAVYLRRSKRLCSGDNSCGDGGEHGPKSELIRQPGPETWKQFRYEDVEPQPKNTKSVLEQFGFINGVQSAQQTRTTSGGKQEPPEDGEVGCLNFSLQYSRKTTAIQLNLVQAKIKSVKAGEEFFFRASLLPAEIAVEQSKYFTNNSRGGPVQLNQSLSFEGSNFKTTSSYVLSLHAIGGDGCKPLGEIKIPLKDVKLGNCPVYWKHLNAPTMKVGGSLMLTLCWQPTLCRLKLVVNQAKNLLGRKDDLDTYVKISVLSGQSVLAYRKTTVQLHDANPSYEEPFVFDLNTISKMEDLQFELKLFRLNSVPEARGTVLLGRNGDEDGFLHFLEVLAKPGFLVPMWHRLG